MLGLLVDKLDKARMEDKEKCATAVVRPFFSVFRLSRFFGLLIWSCNQCSRKEEAADRAKAPGYSKETDSV
jgi:hypothetical protein